LVSPARVVDTGQLGQLLGESVCLGIANVQRHGGDLCRRVDDSLVVKHDRCNATAIGASLATPQEGADWPAVPIGGTTPSRVGIANGKDASDRAAASMTRARSLSACNPPIDL
jgi:hypothetical protein